MTIRVGDVVLVSENPVGTTARNLAGCFGVVNKVVSEADGTTLFVSFRGIGQPFKTDRWLREGDLTAVGVMPALRPEGCGQEEAAPAEVKFREFL